MTDKNKILDRVSSPQSLRELGDAELKQLAAEIRQQIIDVVSTRGGHLASNLGIAELTIALHSVFDFASDRLLWDVGHQCYAHKILTGRGGRFHTLRQSGGLSGFPAPSESDYDLFATGHAGTAISTAVGLAWADQALGRGNKVVAVVGDASIVNGVSLEGINNAALLRRQFLIVLNDNSMAIDRTHGAMARALDRIRMTPTYTGLRQSAENILHHLPLGQEISEAIKSIKAGLKASIHGGQIFEGLGFEYYGPVDGHNIHEMIRVLTRLADIPRPVLLHVHTEKGRGCQYAVEDPCRFHSPSAWTVHGEKPVFPARERPSWTQVFGQALAELGGEDQRVVAITAAMPDGTGLKTFREQFPDRYVDVGISESHAVAMAGGLAKAGLRPVVAVYSTFLQRGMDQIFQEACLQKLPVILCMDRSGLVGSDGAVHHGFMDIAYLRPLPGIVLMAPADAAEMKAALRLALSLDGPAALRYPRDEVPDDIPGDCPPFELGISRVLREGRDGTFLCYGVMVEPALAAADKLAEEGLQVAVVNARFAKPLDAAQISRRIASSKPVVVVEDHVVAGGFGSAVLELAAQRGLDAAKVQLMGLPDRFIPHASRAEQLLEAQLDVGHLVAAMKAMMPVARSRQGKAFPS